MPVNFASSQVVTAPSPAISGTTLTVVPGHGANFPGVPFNAVVADSSEVLRTLSRESEIVRVTNIATDTLTIDRAQESTSARTIIVGDRVYAGITGGITTRYVPGLGSNSIVPGPGPIHAPGAYSPSNNEWFALRGLIVSEALITGIRYMVTASGGTVKSALYDSTGTRVANRTSGVAVGAVDTFQGVLFDSAYSADPGVYYTLLWFSSGAAEYQGAIFATPTDGGIDAGGPPASISPAVGYGFVPLMVTF